MLDVHCEAISESFPAKQVDIKRSSQLSLFPRQSKTHSEWSTLHFGHGGYKGKKTGREFQRLPFYCCALSLTPFENPRCTKDGYIFELLNIVPWLKKHGTNPITGEPLATKDLITLHFHKNSSGEYHDPITFKVFTESTHIVAVGTTGHVYAYESIDELNIKPKNWNDLMTDEPFKRKDLITIQDPHNLAGRDISQFHYRAKGLELPDSVAASTGTGASTSSSDAINARGTTARILAEMAPKKPAAPPATSSSAVTPSFVPVASRSYNQAHFSNNAVAASFTSLGAVAVTNNAPAVISDDEYLISKVKGNGYAQIKTSLGDLNIELYCGDTPRTCLNFLMLAKSGYYKNVPFHRLIPKFMIQTGDPTGTGKGGKSYYGYPFPDEFHPNHSHKERGTLSMANRGTDTNQSQFFVTFGACTHLDKKHTVFGKVVGGMDVLDKMESVPADKLDKPKLPITMEDVVVFVDPFDDVRKVIAGEDEATVKKRARDAARQSRREASERANEAPASSGGAIGKYLNLETAKKRASESVIADDVVTRGAPGTGAAAAEGEKKKKPKTGGFSNFDSW
ncbi:hypothetical protein DFJ73DRAFT_648635 [Zopfochytrium polystomum]|nr:hypothetical protein DFJ73DRAFT_648635 [Zopfochytrium polystomum]